MDAMSLFDPEKIAGAGAAKAGFPLSPAALPGPSGKGGGFAGALQTAVNNLVAPQQDAARAVEQFAAGHNGELHKTMLTMERADITMKFFVSLRNKALEAYREVMHMGS